MSRTLFTDEEPKRDFLWVLFNREGTEDTRLVPIADYRIFVRLYGVPATGWRYPEAGNT